MAKKKIVKRVALPVPTSIEEVANLVRRIGEHQRALTVIQAETGNKMEEIKSKATADCSPHQDAIENLFEAVYIFAQTNRDELTEEGKKKTVNLPTGEFHWRLTPPAVSVRNVKKVIALCKSLGLKRFLRVKEEVDREALLKEPETAKEIKGVTITQREEFVVKPAEAQVEISKNTRDFKKR